MLKYSQMHHYNNNDSYFQLNIEFAKLTDNEVRGNMSVNSFKLNIKKSILNIALCIYHRIHIY